MRAVLSLRLFRLLRTLRKVHAFSLIASTFFRLLPAATTLLKTVGLLMFVFACVGLHLFGAALCGAAALMVFICIASGSAANRAAIDA